MYGIAVQLRLGLEKMQPRTRPLAAGAGAVAAKPPVYQLHNSIDGDTDPKVHYKAEIEPVGMMAPCRRKVRHQNEKVKQVAHDNGDELLEQATEHLSVVQQPATSN